MVHSPDSDHPCLIMKLTSLTTHESTSTPSKYHIQKHQNGQTAQNSFPSLVCLPLTPKTLEGHEYLTSQYHLNIINTFTRHYKTSKKGAAAAETQGSPQRAASMVTSDRRLHIRVFVRAVTERPVLRLFTHAEPDLLVGIGQVLHRSLFDGFERVPVAAVAQRLRNRWE